MDELWDDFTVEVSASNRKKTRESRVDWRMDAAV